MRYTFGKMPKLDKTTAVLSLVEEGVGGRVRTAPLGTTIEVVAGKSSLMTRRKLITLARKAVREAKAAKMRTLVIRMEELAFPGIGCTDLELGRLVAENIEMANFEFVKYRTKPKDGWDALRAVHFAGRSGKDFERGIREGRIIGEEVNKTRDLANTPGGDMTPSKLAEAAKTAAHGLPIEVTVLDEKEMEELGMGAILGVGRGSEDKPRFIVMEYRGGAEGEAPIVFVGKGVTFDSGGLNLKPSDGIYEMHMDMSGGAATIHAIVLAARLKLKKNIITLVPAVENMPSGSSYHPGDLLRSMSGKTIEILNTDAEGRVILADALHYAKRYKPALVVDIATLTGAAMVALGTKASAIFTREEDIAADLRELAEESGDYVWQLPLWDEYEADIKGTFGDWANTGKGRNGGAITGAMFLYQFVKDEKGEAAYPWVHIDIAPRMTAGEGDELAKGAAGAPVRLLSRIMERY